MGLNCIPTTYLDPVVKQLYCIQALREQVLRMRTHILMS